jgi:hypothetical protein
VDIFRVKSAIKLLVPFVLSVVVAYRLLDIGMDLGAEGAIAFGSWPQQSSWAGASIKSPP